LPRARKLRHGEVILLYQRVDSIEGVKDNGYLTHLVTPKMGTELISTGEPGDFSNYREMLVVARAEPRTSIPSNTSEFNFRGVSFGKINDIKGIASRSGKEPVLKEVIQKLVWSKFKGHFLTSVHNVGEITDEEIEREFELSDDTGRLLIRSYRI